MTNQVHQDLSPIVKDLRVKVSGTCTLMILVRTYLWLWFVLQVRRLIPKQRNGSTCLHEGAAIPINLDQLLCLHVIGNVPSRVYTARK